MKFNQVLVKLNWTLVGFNQKNFLVFLGLTELNTDKPRKAMKNQD